MHSIPHPCGSRIAKIATATTTQGTLAFPLLLSLVFTAFTGCSSDTGSGKEAGSPVVLVDNQTFEVFLIETKPTGAVSNPTTGRNTLMMGAYCPDCDRWYPLPPMEVLQRSASARNCPVHKTPLQADGPVPEAAQQLTL